MRFTFVVLLLALFALSVWAVAPQKQVIVTYSNDTPDHIIAEAKKAIEEAGGFITHEYKLIKGFAATAPAKILESVKTLGSQYNAVVEEDQVVSINGAMGGSA